MRKKYFSLFMMAFWVNATHAAGYPEKDISLIMPFAAGGTTDIIANAIIPSLEKALGRQIIILNRAGQGGITGTAELLRSRPDGYTLSMATVSTVATNPAVDRAIKYDPLTDLTPIINIAATPNVLSVHPLFPANNFEEFLNVVRANPGKFSYASTGSGGIAHIQMEIFKSYTQTEMVHVPFRGASPAIADVVNGQVMIMMDNLPSSINLLRTQRLKPMAVGSAKRLDFLPQVPTFKELGYDSVNRYAFYGLVGPKNLPKDIVKKLNNAVLEVLKNPEVRKRLESQGAIILGGTADDFAKQIAEELIFYKNEVEARNLQKN
jgi:tripartite-type tricarboxylate transporter receptor subunit TctC